MHRVIASWFGSGLILHRIRGSHAGSGTVGSAVAFPIALAIGQIGWIPQLIAAVFVTILSLWSARPFAVDHADPGWVVVDEAAGIFVATIGLGWKAGLVAFVVFRIADATKRFPGVGPAEALPGAVGITADDLVAGVWGLAAGWAAQAWIF